MGKFSACAYGRRVGEAGREAATAAQISAINPAVSPIAGYMLGNPEAAPSMQVRPRTAPPRLRREKWASTCKGAFCYRLRCSDS